MEQHPDGLSTDRWNDPAPHRFLGQQAHRPARKALRRRRTYQRNHLLRLLRIEQRSAARTRRIQQRALQSADQIPLPDLPHRLAREANQQSNFGSGKTAIQVPQRERAEHRPHLLHPATQQLLDPLTGTGNIFEAVAERAGTKVAQLSHGLEDYRAGQTGLLRIPWDNGDRTVLVNTELGGVILGWNLVSTAQDELFAAIEGTALHTRIILERMAQHNVPVERVINAGGVPQNNHVLNQVYANVLNKPVLVPAGLPTSLGSGIFALLAAGAFPSIEAAQQVSNVSSKQNLHSRPGGSSDL